MRAKILYAHYVVRSLCLCLVELLCMQVSCEIQNQITWENTMYCISYIYNNKDCSPCCGKLEFGYCIICIADERTNGMDTGQVTQILT